MFSYGYHKQIHNPISAIHAKMRQCLSFEATFNILMPFFISLLLLQQFQLSHHMFFKTLKHHFCIIFIPLHCQSYSNYWSSCARLCMYDMQMAICPFLLLPCAGNLNLYVGGHIISSQFLLVCKTPQVFPSQEYILVTMIFHWRQFKQEKYRCIVFSPIILKPQIFHFCTFQHEMCHSNTF